MTAVHHADIADNNENMKDEIENVNAGDFAAISLHCAANPGGWQPELPEKGKVVFGHKSGQPLPQEAFREARRPRNVRHRCTGCRASQAGKGQVALRLGKERNEIAIGCSAVQLGKT